MKPRKENLSSLDGFFHASVSKKLIIGVVIFSIIPLSFFSSFFLYKAHLVEQVFLLGIIITLSLGILYWYYYVTITKPLQKLHQAARNIENGDLNERVMFRSGDELETLAHSLNSVMESLQHAKKDREQLEKAKSEFLSITGHELRSPMTPVKAQLQLLMGGYLGKLSKKQTDHLEIVLRNIDKLNNVLNDYLEIARIDTGRLKFNYTKINLEESIQKLVGEMKSFKPEKKVKISYEIEKIPKVVVDSEKLGRILRNLLSNAIKFSNPGGKVTIKVTHPQNRIHFKVEDSGIGIEPSNTKVIFDPFFQEDHKLNREYEGTGLGLTIVKGLVHAQGGDISISSKKGKGSTVSFTLPSQPIQRPVAVPIMASHTKKGWKNE